MEFGIGGSHYVYAFPRLDHAKYRGWLMDPVTNSISWIPSRAVLIGDFRSDMHGGQWDAVDGTLPLLRVAQMALRLMTTGGSTRTPMAAGKTR
jgi:hypothetical protein